MFIPWWLLIVLVLVSVPAAIDYWSNYTIKKEHLNTLGNDEYLQAYLLRLIHEQYEKQIQFYVLNGGNSDDIDQAKNNLKFLIKNPMEVIEDEDGEEIDETDEEALRERVTDLFN